MRVAAKLAKERRDIEVEPTAADEAVLELVDADHRDLDLGAGDRDAQSLVHVAAAEDGLDDAEPTRIVDGHAQDPLDRVRERLEIERPEHRAYRGAAPQDPAERHLLERRVRREVLRIAASRVRLEQIAN